MNCLVLPSGESAFWEFLWDLATCGVCATAIHIVKRPALSARLSPLQWEAREGTRLSRDFGPIASAAAQGDRGPAAPESGASCNLQRTNACA